MQGLRKGEWSAITKVKVFSPEICHIALGQGFHHLEASSAARDNGECVSDVPGSESMAGHSMIHSGTWESHVALKRSLHQAEEARRGYGGMAVGPVHSKGVAGVMPTESPCWMLLLILLLTQVSLSSDIIGNPAYDRYCGLKSLKFKGTGYFRLQNTDNRTLLVSPEGHGFVALGVNHIGSLAGTDLFTNEYSADWNRYKKILQQQLFSWNMNNLGYGSPKALQTVLPYFATITLAPIEKHRSAPKSDIPNGYRFPDVFDLIWQRQVETLIKRVCIQHRNNPYLIGYFWTDTPTWDLVKTRGLRGTDWVSAIRQLPPSAPGKQRYAAFLQHRYQGRLDELNKIYSIVLPSLDVIAQHDFSKIAIGRHVVNRDDDDFLEIIAQQFYTTVGKVQRLHDPNHLVFGDRYLVGDAPASVLQAASSWIDAVSIQPGDRYTKLYPPSTRFPERAIERMHRITGKPVIICDHAISFPTSNHPKTIFEQKPTQAEAARATDIFVRAAFHKPYIVGYLRCQYIDRPAGFGRGLRQGLLDAEGKPYEFMVNTYRHVFKEVLKAVECGKTIASGYPNSVTVPVFDIWYGDMQYFGRQGHPQRWINILGHVTPGEHIESLTYSLNGSKQQKLSFREDFKRLARTGDFNLEIDRAVLHPGKNRIVLHATTRTTQTKEHIVTIVYDPSDKRWPLPYKIDWRKVSKIQDVAQVVDGKWKLTDRGIRSIEPYYDRVIAFGDDTWQNYEVMSSVIFHGFTPPKTSPNTTGVSHAALALRWPGHDQDVLQPHVKWYPLGATAEFQLSWNLDQCRWRIFDGKREFYVESKRHREIEFERLYHLKHRVETLNEGQSRYRAKLWPDGEPEPDDWDLERYETDDLASGSALLIAHHTDVTFVSVQVNSISIQR